VLFGDVNPSGRLAITIPRHSGQLPAYYNYKPSKEYWLTKGWGTHYVDMPATPLYPFGFGLSYTKFEYSNLRIEPASMRNRGTARVSVDLKNTGAREGTEIAQLYIHDVLASVATPVKQLRGFQRLTLKPGETRTVQFTVTPDELKLLNREMRWVVEPGDFNILIGASSADIRLKGKLQVAD
jgi:beta-glucosidase